MPVDTVGLSPLYDSLTHQLFLVLRVESHLYSQISPLCYHMALCSPLQLLHWSLWRHRLPTAYRQSIGAHLHLGEVPTVLMGVRVVLLLVTIRLKPFCAEVIRKPIISL